ncbi:Hexon-interlacing protein [Bienertia sinuspersici]
MAPEKGRNDVGKCDGGDGASLMVAVSLMVLDDVREQSTEEKGEEKETFRVLPPNFEKWVSGKSPKAILNSSHHQENATTKPLGTLYDRISRKEATWSSKPQFGVVFSHIPLYWEWTEDIIRRCKHTFTSIDLLDAVYTSMFLYKCNSPMMQRFCESWCPTTNTIHTGDGEASISLWDLRTLGGLPIFGAFYDEVVPTVDELEGSKDGRQFLPPSCRYMFAALQTIMLTSESSHVTFEEWCRFWFRVPKRYSATILPKAVESFSEFGELESWSNKHEALIILDVPKEHCQQTYLAAFLSCWLCAFVFPLKNLGCIRPSVFKPASQLASGQRTSLVIPVLASIYRGLNELSHSSTPGRQCSNFPTHYVYAWTAQYFRSHRMSVHNFAGAQMIAFHGTSNVKKLTSAEAKAFVRSGKDINWIGNSTHDTSDRKLIDDGLSRLDIDFLLSIRSCYLTLRYDDEYVVEPYSPHRFSRQFGFCQNIPGELKPYSQKISLQYLWSLFQTSIRVGTKSSFLIPAGGMNIGICSRVTAPFKLWWSTSYAHSGPSPSPPSTNSSRKRKTNSTSISDKDAKAPLDTSDEGRGKLSRKSSSQSSRETSPHDEKTDERKAPSQSPNGQRTIFHDIFGEDEATLEEGQKDDHDLDYTKELEACGNTFASADSNGLVVASDPIALCAAITIIARDSETFHDVLTVPTGDSSFNARVMISEADYPELKELFGYISSKNIDVTNLREHVEAYVDHACKFHTLEPSDNIQSSLPNLEEQLSCIQQKCDELQKELKLLEQKESELSSTLANSKDSLTKHDATVKDLTVFHTSLEKDIATAKEATTKRKEAEENFQNARDALESLQWEP